MENQFLTVFNLWSLKAYTKCFYKLTARSGWFKSPLLAVDHGWAAKENFEFHPFTNASNGLHETFWYIFSLILFLKSYLLNRSNACTIIFVKWTKLHHDLSNFLRNLSQLQNLRCASLPPHSNAPYDVMENWENLDSNKRIKQIVKALVDPLSPTRSIVLTGRETFSVRFLWILRNM